MMPPRRFVPFFATLLTAICLFSEPIIAQRPPSESRPGGTNQTRGFSVRGMVSDAQDHNRIDGVKVDLRAFSGGTIATAFTSGEGTFQFNNIGSGSYELIVEAIGYETTHQPVQIDSPVFGLLIEIRRARVPGTRPRGGPGIVSKRELSIPHKAHDALVKGMDLLYGKSDYPGSVKQFQRAIQAYPEYYEAYAQMGIAYMRLGDTAGSEQALRKSLDLSDRHYVDALSWLASLFSNGEHFDQAEPLARKAVELDAKSWQGHSELARALLGLNRAAEAEVSAAAAMELRPDNANLHLLLANVHIALQNYPALLDDLNGYLKLAPQGPFADQARKQRDNVQQELENAQASPAPLPAPKP